MKKTKILTIKNVNGQWYAQADGEKRLTAQETAALIAKGVPYQIIFSPQGSRLLAGEPSTEI